MIKLTLLSLISGYLFSASMMLVINGPILVLLIFNVFFPFGFDLGTWSTLCGMSTGPRVRLCARSAYA